MYLKIRFANAKLAQEASPENPPCVNAEMRTHVIIERFPLTGNPEADASIRKKWKSAGACHREQDSILFRDVAIRDWYVMWTTTGKMRELVDKYGGAYLRRSMENPKYWEVIVGPTVEYEAREANIVG